MKSFEQAGSSSDSGKPAGKKKRTMDHGPLGGLFRLLPPGSRRLAAAAALGVADLLSDRMPDKEAKEALNLANAQGMVQEQDEEREREQRELRAAQVVDELTVQELQAKIGRS